MVIIIFFVLHSDSSSEGCPGLVLAKVSGVAVNCDTELQSWLLSSLNKLQDACSSSGSATAGGVTPHKR